MFACVFRSRPSTSSFGVATRQATERRRRRRRPPFFAQFAPICQLQYRKVIGAHCFAIVLILSPIYYIKAKHLNIFKTCSCHLMEQRYPSSSKHIVVSRGFVIIVAKHTQPRRQMRQDIKARPALSTNHLTFPSFLLSRKSMPNVMLSIKIAMISRR